MNNKRRKLLRDAIGLLEQAEGAINRVSDEEQNSLDDTPENLQSSERAERMEDVIDLLSDAIEKIDEAKAQVSAAI